MIIGNLEFIDNLDRDRPSEIVCHSNGSKFTILWFKKDSEGYKIKSVGDRIFLDTFDHEHLWQLMHYGMKVLSARQTLLERTGN